jgi:ribonuclease P protein component
VRDQADQASDPTSESTAAGDGSPFIETRRCGKFSFTPADRIRKKSEYATVFSNSRKVVDRYFVCYLSTGEQSGSKIGLAVSRKVGKAVTRNRVKRYLREFYRSHRPYFTAPCHVVVVARPAAAGMSYVECTHAMKQLLRRGGVLHD